MKETAGILMKCSVCGREMGSMSYTVEGDILCPDCYCKKFGVCG